MSDPVVGADGRTWRVRRHWVPRLGEETVWGRFTHRARRRWKRGDDTGFVADAVVEGAFDLSLVPVALAVVAFVVFMVFLGWPLLLAVLDLVLVVVLAVLGLVGRVLLRRPWTVEARADDGRRMRWRIVGWRASGEWIRDVETRLQLGTLPD